MTDPKPLPNNAAAKQPNDVRTLPPENVAAWVALQTPARIVLPRAGAAMATKDWLQLRADHAAAQDAVLAEMDETSFPKGLVADYGLFVVQSQASSKSEFLLRPELGRRLSKEAAAEIAQRCPRNTDVQIVVGDGLSAAAIKQQVPLLLPALAAEIQTRGWTLGQVFAIRYCRVGILNELGPLLGCRVIALLIGERPGLATHESLSCYMAYQPRPEHTDANRNLISNIHARGLPPELAARRIANLMQTMLAQCVSGTSVKEQLDLLP